MEDAADTAMSGDSAQRASARICTAAAFKISDPFIIGRMSIVLPKGKFLKDERRLII
jgi:hypothetical protein